MPRPAPAAGSQPRCPACYSFDVQPSRRRFLDALVGRGKPYRCLSCWRRFFVRVPAEALPPGEP